MVAGGHRNVTPSSIKHSSVVSRDSVCIALTLAASNNLQVLECVIQNTNLTAKNENTGPEFGSETGEIMLVVR